MVSSSGDEPGAVAIYSGRASDFPVGSPLSQIQPLDAFVFAGPGNKPSANLTETLIPGRQPYQLSNRQGTMIVFHSNKTAPIRLQYMQEVERVNASLLKLTMCCYQEALVMFSGRFLTP